MRRSLNLLLDTEYGPAEDDAALHRLLHEVRGECGEGGVHDEGHQEHEDREPGDRDQGEGEGGVEPDRLPRRPGRGLLLLLLGQRLNKVIPSAFISSPCYIIHYAQHFGHYLVILSHPM